MTDRTDRDISFHSTRPHRDYAGEYESLLSRQDGFVQEKDDLYRAWAADLRARIEALYNPRTNRSMGVMPFQKLLPGYDTKSPILLNALRGTNRSVRLLIAATTLVERLEHDSTYATPESTPEAPK